MVRAEEEAEEAREVERGSTRCDRTRKISGEQDIHNESIFIVPKPSDHILTLVAYQWIPPSGGH